MDDAAVPVAQQESPALPGSEQVNSVPEVKEKPEAEKWPFSEPQPIREEQVRNAVNFLSHPKVRGTPMVQRFSFLERKGLTREEIDEAFRRCPDSPINDATKAVVSSEGSGNLMTGPQTQAYSPTTHQKAIVSSSPPAQHYVNGPSSAIVPARSGSSWSQLILGAGLIAAAGAGTSYFIQRVLAPKLRAWLYDMVLDERKATEKLSKPSPLEEAVGAAAAAANAAAAAAAEVVNTSREVLKLQAEERQQLRSLIKSLDSKADELNSTLAVMRKTAQVAEGRTVSAHAEEPIGANFYNGSMKTYQRTATPVNQVQMKQDMQMSKSMEMGNGVDKPYSNGYSTSSTPHSEEEPWWHQKKVEVETIMAPKRDMESSVSELEAGLDQGIGNSLFRNSELGAPGRGGPLGRQGWTPPPAPQTVMPGAASAIRYQRVSLVNEVKPSILSEEREANLEASSEEQPQPFLPMAMPGSPSAVRLQNPVTRKETTRQVLAGEKEVDVQNFSDQHKSSVVEEIAEIVEITSVDKEISLQQSQPFLQTAMPGSPSAIRLQNPATSEETARQVLVDEKEVDVRTFSDQHKSSVVEEIAENMSVDKEIPLQQPQPFLQTAVPGSPSAIRSQNAATSEEIARQVLADEKEVDVQTFSDQRESSVVEEIVEASSALSDAW